MLNSRLGLGEQVSKLMLSGNILGNQGTLTVVVAKEEDIHPDMLGERKLHWIQRELNDAGVVTKESSRARRDNTKICKKST